MSYQFPIMSLPPPNELPPPLPFIEELLPQPSDDDVAASLLVLKGGTRTQLWSEKEVASLLDLVGSYQAELNDKVHKKKEVWNCIRNALNDQSGTSFTLDQVNVKYRVILKKYRDFMTRLSSTGDRCKVQPAFFEEMHKIVGGVGVAGSASSAVDGTDAFTPADANKINDIRKVSKRKAVTAPRKISPKIPPVKLHLEDKPVAAPSKVSAMMPPVHKESYQLQHNNHMSIVLNQLAEDEAFMDVTLTAEGRPIKAHKSVLSAVSPYFSSVLRANPCQHPIIIMPSEIGFSELKNVITYIYRGQLTVPYEDIEKLLKAAELLQVVGLTSGDADKSDLNDTPLPDRQPASATNKRPRLSNVSDFLHSSSNDVDDLNPSDFLHKSVDRPKDADGADKLDNTQVLVTQSAVEAMKHEVVTIKVEATDLPTEVTTFDGLMASDDEEEDPNALPSLVVCPHCQLFYPRDSMTQHLNTHFDNSND